MSSAGMESSDIKSGRGDWFVARLKKCDYEDRKMPSGRGLYEVVRQLCRNAGTAGRRLPDDVILGEADFAKENLMAAGFSSWQVRNIHAFLRGANSIRWE